MTIGFIGLGVMGEPMCRNLARKSGQAVAAFDLSPAPLERLRRQGVTAADDAAALARACDVVFLSLPGGNELQSVCAGLLAHARGGQIVVDLGTSPVRLTRALARSFAATGAHYADAPVARTREAAEQGTLSVMVGADEATFAAIRPLLACFAAEVTLCGAVGAGQITKLMNNMVLIETVIALSEALALACRAGADGKLLLETLAKGSADSFALRNHGLKAIVPGVFPAPAFSAAYALKDLGYALELAQEMGLALPAARVAERRLREAIAEGYGEQYWPVVSRIVDGGDRVGRDERL
jgi:hypothetical protein